MPYITGSIAEGLGNQLHVVNAIFGVSQKYQKYTPIILRSLILDQAYKHSKDLYFDKFIHITIDENINHDDSWIYLHENNYNTFDFEKNTSNIILAGYYQNKIYGPERSFSQRLFNCDIDNVEGFPKSADLQGS